MLYFTIKQRLKKNAKIGLDKSNCITHIAVHKILITTIILMFTSDIYSK